jgi:hypothetical protein
VGYLIAGNYNALLFFLLISLIVRFFNENKALILASALIATNLLIGGKMIKESFEGDESPKKKGSETDKKNGASTKPAKSSEVANKTGMANIHEDDDDSSEVEGKGHSSGNQEKMASGKTSQLDYAGTVESAYDNLDKLLSSDALKNMSMDTQRLAEKQKRLMGSIKNLEPMMNQANKLLEGLDMSGINSMMGKISNMSMMTGIGGIVDEQDKVVASKKK